MIGMRIEQIGPDLPLRELVSFAHNPEGLRKVLGAEAANQVKKNFNRLAQKPNRLGAPSTGYWRDAANSVSWRVVGRGAIELTVSQVGVRLHLLGGTVRPVRRKMLAIPVHPEAHGKSPREFSDLEFVVGPNAIGLARKVPFSDQPEWLFVLKRSVTIRAKPDTLPSDRDMDNALLSRAQRFINRELDRMHRERGRP